eukprot:m51a1_g6110 hypothetical protein (159) ;mRNA; r:92537-93129
MADRTLQLVQGIEDELKVLREHLCDPDTAPVDHVSLVVVNSEALKFLAALKSANKAAQQLEQQKQPAATTRSRANSETRVPTLPLFIRRQQMPEPLMRRETSSAGSVGLQSSCGWPTVCIPQALSAPTQRGVVVPQFTPRTYRERARALLEDLAPVTP